MCQHTTKTLIELGNGSQINLWRHYIHNLTVVMFGLVPGHMYNPQCSPINTYLDITYTTKHSRERRTDTIIRNHLSPASTALNPSFSDINGMRDGHGHV